MYEKRFNGMAIVMINPEKKFAYLAKCACNNLIEELEILEKGIGRGCSLTFDAGVLPA